MGNRSRSPPPPTIWSYGYEISPPLPPARLRTIERLLAIEQSKARRLDRRWASRFIVDDRVTHIMVVSDSPNQQLEINRRLEDELAKLKAGFSITPPLVVVDDDERQAPSDDLPPTDPPVGRSDR